jgi:hypothetical protein
LTQKDALSALSLQDLADLAERELGHVPQWASRKRYYPRVN